MFAQSAGDYGVTLSGNVTFAVSRASYDYAACESTLPASETSGWGSACFNTGRSRRQDEHFDV